MRSVWDRRGPQDHDAAARTVDYLARYANRVAISNGRLVAIEGEEVLFRYKDYRDADQWKTERITGVEFIGRFLQHVLPQRLHHIRHFGFMGTRVRTERLKQIRPLLDVKTAEPSASEGDERNDSEEERERQDADQPTPRHCRYCGVRRISPTTLRCAGARRDVGD